MAELELADVAVGGGEANHTNTDQVILTDFMPETSTGECIGSQGNPYVLGYAILYGQSKQTGYTRRKVMFRN